MTANVPKTDISGLVRSAADLMDAAFKKGVKRGRYLEQQNRKKGHWIDECTWIICSECGAKYSNEIVFMNRNLEDENPKFCPNCGARMEVIPDDDSGR